MTAELPPAEDAESNLRAALQAFTAPEGKSP